MSCDDACIATLSESRKRAHCATCHETFSTVGNFDAHLRGYDPVACLTVEAAGLRRGRWGVVVGPPPKTPLSSRRSTESEAT